MTLGGWMTRVMFQTANTATPTAPISPLSSFAATPGQVAQLVEQRTENPRVGSSILPLAIAIERLGGAARRRLCQRCVNRGASPGRTRAISAMRTRAISNGTECCSWPAGGNWPGRFDERDSSSG